MKELFVVEGESAASTIRQAMHKQNQSVHALQGKLINAAKAAPAKVLSNQVCQKLFQSLACGVRDDCDPNRLNFSNILILMDPDADGAHARVLVLTLFDLYLRPLMDSGLVSVIIPPLFRLTELQTLQHQYAWNEQQRMQLSSAMNHYGEVEITRFKGVAQFSAAECTRLLLNPDTRKQMNMLNSQI